jgi:hypothetical protein
MPDERVNPQVGRAKQARRLAARCNGGQGFWEDPDQSKFPIGAQGSAAIYTGGEHGAWGALRKISIRAHSWLNWVYPLNF